MFRPVAARLRAISRRLAALAVLPALALAACAGPPAPATPAAIPSAAPRRTAVPSAVPPTPTPFPEAATAVARATAAPTPAFSAVCRAAGGGASLTYAEAAEIAAFSECAAAGELLEANLCNEQTGTWWLALDAPRDGCNPACVIDIQSRSAAINWRCTGLAEGGATAAPTPAPALPLQEALAAAADPPATPTPAPAEEAGAAGAGDSWSGEVMRLPGAAQARYQLLTDEGQALLVQAQDGALQEVLAEAAWRGAPLALRGTQDADGEVLQATAVRSVGAPGSAPRNLAPFAFPSASSAAPADAGGTYEGWSAVDGDPARPWCEGKAGPGEGEWLQLDFAAPLLISELRLSNGFDQDGFLYESNDQVIAATFTFDEGEPLRWEFAVQRGLQSVPVEPPRRARSVRLTIDGVREGWEYRDACIGELEVWGRGE